MILNETTDEKINIKIENAEGFFERLKGLMGKKNFENGMMFSNLKDSSVHTCFMRFEIDVYFLDKNKKVIDKKTLKPWRFYRPKKQAEYVNETKKDLIDLKINDKIRIL